MVLIPFPMGDLADPLGRPGRRLRRSGSRERNPPVLLPADPPCCLTNRIRASHWFPKSHKRVMATPQQHGLSSHLRGKTAEPIVTFHKYLATWRLTPE